jgi:hypothetical protein
VLIWDDAQLDGVLAALPTAEMPASKGARRVAREQRRCGLEQQIVALRDAGKTWVEVAAAVGLSHSRVRALHSRATGDR